MKKWAFGILLSFVFSYPAFADDSGNYFLMELNNNSQDAQSINKRTIGGFAVYEVGEGIISANIAAKDKFGKFIVCIPQEWETSEDNFKNIFISYLNKYPSLGKFPMKFVLLRALQEHFPCEYKKN